jgi:hypothetical protein
MALIQMNLSRSSTRQAQLQPPTRRSWIISGVPVYQRENCLAFRKARLGQFASPAGGTRFLPNEALRFLDF